MTTTIERLTADLTTAMKARDEFAKNTLRQVIGAVRTAEKSGTTAHELTDAEVQTILAAEVKKRRESAQIYADADATERADNETREADFIEKYLPASLTPAELDALVASAIASTGASSMKDMGTVMKTATAAAAGIGRVDGKALSQAVRQALGAL
ncbi:GatB/YqeY domain-containing protein [Oerskovia sp. Sa1BUA8]|uniref:GatB/YqeY domain-containing protein n=1 Tax=Oerskovia douganii TaxID=2762210 RepID=A0A9D5YZ88_9CELL|nr:GatB/YqeY domain-containing protein [Oerskovia douganii]MBE7700256.1 GatB/YqeY domain-containing protein [Oerskovia douganii]